MKQMRIAGILGCVLGLLVLAPAFGADVANDTTLTTTGTASMHVHPQLMRMRLVLNSEGKDLKDALANLAARRDDVKKAIAALGPAGNIAADDPSLGSDPFSAQAAPYVVMPRPKKGQPAPPITVYTALSAEWPLPADSPEKAMIAAADLQAKIKAAIPKPASSAKTPEEQELAEEAQANNPNQQDPNAILVNDPVFIYVHQLSESEQTKLNADAFTAATRDAKRLAAGAGKTLGPLHDLSPGQFSFGSPNYNNTGVDLTHFFASPNDRTAAEVTGTQAAGFDITIQVTVIFRLGE